jgi:hypothetical protein
LLSTQGGISHYGHDIETDEDMTPTLENTVVVMWLQLIHPGLPQLVRQKYGAELRNQTIASLKPEISLALTSLLDELRSIEDTKALRTGSFAYNKQDPNKQHNFKPRTTKNCVLCKSAGRPAYNTHNLKECRYIPESDKRQMYGRTRFVEEVADDLPVIGDHDDNDISDITNDMNLLLDHSVNRVNVIQSPFLSTFYSPHPVKLTLDTGATTNMVRASFAHAIKLPISPASQKTRQADGVTPLDVVGEIHCKLTREDAVFQLDALVVKQLDVDVLAGNPFLVTNDIATRPAKNQIVIKGTHVVYYGNQQEGGTSVRRAQAYLLRSPAHQTTLLPGEFVEFAIPQNCDPDVAWALEPRSDCPSNMQAKPEKAWPNVQEVAAVGHVIRVPNMSDNPIVLKRNEHICQIRPISVMDETLTDNTAGGPPPTTTPSRPFSRDISIDPDNCLSPNMRNKFKELHSEFDDVFNPAVSKYNGASSKLEAIVNMGSTLPPQRKGRLPHYNRDMLVELQGKFDELESMGVFATPEQVNVPVEYLILSFLVRKPNGGTRLVTSFGGVGQYCKPQPSLMPNVDSVLRDIGKWKYIIKTDLLKSFYQIPLSTGSMKYCGVATPFKGVYSMCHGHAWVRNLLGRTDVQSAW